MVYQNVGAILTCAGLSTRMNENKAFINWNGLPLIEQQINLLINSGLNQIAVVVGYEQDRFQYIKDKYSLVKDVEHTWPKGTYPDCILVPHDVIERDIIPALLL